jgi:hypothetical protein
VCRGVPPIREESRSWSPPAVGITTIRARGPPASSTIIRKMSESIDLIVIQVDEVKPMLDRVMAHHERIVGSAPG